MDFTGLPAQYQTTNYQEFVFIDMKHMGVYCLRCPTYLKATKTTIRWIGQKRGQRKGGHCKITLKYTVIQRLWQIPMFVMSRGERPLGQECVKGPNKIVVWLTGTRPGFGLSVNVSLLQSNNSWEKLRGIRKTSVGNGVTEDWRRNLSQQPDWNAWLAPHTSCDLLRHKLFGLIQGQLREI